MDAATPSMSSPLSGANRCPCPAARGTSPTTCRAHELHDVVLVAHSKGGLIGKQMMTDAAVGPRVRGMVAVASPFGGSVYGRLMLLPALRAFSPGAPG
ncbi:MAG: alpha/beta hydrolase, partial [Microbacterium arborescens]